MAVMKPQPGDAAPDFSMSADDGTTVSRESQLGKRYILYFYPKDDTPGCTAQACSLRDNYERVLRTGIEVFGVSPDSVKSHVKFRAKYDLPYRLLSDPGHAVAAAYGVWVEKKYVGRTYMGVERSSFIIGPNGRIEHVLERVKPMEHVDLVLEAMAA
jgi:peroxiredoxin Q/BCP